MTLSLCPPVTSTKKLPVSTLLPWSLECWQGGLPALYHLLAATAGSAYVRFLSVNMSRKLPKGSDCAERLYRICSSWLIAVVCGWGSLFPTNQKGPLQSECVRVVHDRLQVLHIFVGLCSSLE